MDPPQFYYSHQEIDLALSCAGVLRKEYDQEHAQISPSPLSAAAQAAPVFATASQPAVAEAAILSNGLSPFSDNLSSYEYSATGQATQASAMDSGHLVSVTMYYSAPTNVPSARGTKAVVKKLNSIKLDRIIIVGATRSDFIKAFLSIHKLCDQFSPGVHAGPDFRIWWSGSRYVARSTAMIHG
jgi:hypothetical protein